MSLILEGSDAEEFISQDKNPSEPIPEVVEMFRRAVEIYKKNPF